MSNGLPPAWDDALRRLREIKIQVPPAYLESVAIANDRMRELQQQWAAAIAPAVGELAKNWRAQWAPALEQFREAWARTLPSNWTNLSADEVMKVIARVRETGVCLVWIPREDVLRAVLAASPDDTEVVLLAHRDEVLDDVEACLNDVHGPELDDERGAVLQAIAALRDGHASAAQALACSAFTSITHVFFATSKTKKIRNEMADEDPAEAGFSEIRIRTIYAAGAHAFADFRPETAWPRHKRFNRHNTSHRITAEQFSEGNALTAIMLSAALIRELDYWYDLANKRDAPGASE